MHPSDPPAADEIAAAAALLEEELDVLIGNFRALSAVEQGAGVRASLAKRLVAENPPDILAALLGAAVERLALGAR